MRSPLRRALFSWTAAGLQNSAFKGGRPHLTRAYDDFLMTALSYGGIVKVAFEEATSAARRAGITRHAVPCALAIEDIRYDTFESCHLYARASGFWLSSAGFLSRRQQCSPENITPDI